MEDNAEKIQVIEHKERLLAAKLDEVMRREHELSTERGRLQSELRRLENDRYRVLSRAR